MLSKIVLFLLSLTLVCSCKQSTKAPKATTPTVEKVIPKPEKDTPTPQPKVNKDTIRKDQKWTDMSKVAPQIQQDIRYATTNNFINQQIYECGKCLLRPDVAEALVATQKELEAKGYGLKVFDCYRPRPMQQKLWDVKPDKRYVTPPEKGSMHNRGAAVDLTLVDKDGNELEMGTGFDSFERKAWHTYTDLPEEVLENRKILKTTMEANGFRSIRTEWWHYSYVKKGGFGLESDLWHCH